MDEVMLRGFKVKTPVGYREWELWLNLSTGEVYEKIRRESGDTSGMLTLESYGCFLYNRNVTKISEKV